MEGPVATLKDPGVPRFLEPSFKLIILSGKHRMICEAVQALIMITLLILRALKLLLNVMIFIVVK